MKNQDFINKLRNSGLRPTKQRIKIITHKKKILKKLRNNSKKKLRKISSIIIKNNKVK